MAIKVSENTAISMPMRNLLAILVAVACGIFAYTEITARLTSLETSRELFNADFIVWVDTIKKGKYDDTNAMVVKPEKFDFHVTTHDAKVWATQLAEKIK